MTEIEKLWKRERELLSELKSVRLKLANKKKAAAGEAIGRPKVRDDKKIRALRARGYSIRKIAKEIGMSIGTVQAALAS
jgi:DNA invertase Pin-like site-specific DNA recombinase